MISSQSMVGIYIYTAVRHKERCDILNKTEICLLLNLGKKDARSTTESNWRNIVLLPGKYRTNDLKAIDVDNLEYATVKVKVWS